MTIITVAKRDQTLNIENVERERGRKKERKGVREGWRKIDRKKI